MRRSLIPTQGKDFGFQRPQHPTAVSSRQPYTNSPPPPPSPLPHPIPAFPDPLWMMLMMITLTGAMRVFIISSLRREMSSARMLKGPGRNRVQITCTTSDAYHVHVLRHVVLMESSAIQSGKVKIAFISALLAEPIHRSREGGGGPKYPEKPPDDDRQVAQSHRPLGALTGPCPWLHVIPGCPASRGVLANRPFQRLLLLSSRAWVAVLLKGRHDSEWSTKLGVHCNSHIGKAIGYAFGAMLVIIGENIAIDDRQFLVLILFHPDSWSVVLRTALHQCW